MKKLVIDKNQENNVVNLYKSGLSKQQIADIYGVSTGPIKRILKANNITQKDKVGRFSNEDMTTIVEMYNNGMSTYDIGKLYNTTDETIRCWLNKYGIDRRHSVYTVDEHYFDIIDTQEKAYILGLLYADGYHNKQKNTISITLQEEDKHILDEINLLIQNTHPLIFVNNKKYKESWKNCYKLLITNSHMSCVLEKYGLLQNKSLILKFPDWLDKSLQRHFIRGYFDGDGHISKQQYKYNMSIVGTQDFCDGISTIIEKELQLFPHLYISSLEEKSTRTLMLTRKNDCKMFFDWIYEDASLFLKRKYDVYLDKYCKK